MLVLDDLAAAHDGGVNLQWRPGDALGRADAILQEDYHELKLHT